MTTTYQPTDTIRLYVTFVDHDPLTGEEIPVDPSSTSAEFFKDISSSWVSQGSVTLIEDLDPGTFYYDWVPGSSGKFRFNFTATVNISDTITNQRIIYVGDIDPDVSLGIDYTYNFTGTLDPFYIDPELVLSYYPEGDIIEVSELIYRYSRQLETIVGEDPITELTPTMEMYILASVLCELSRIYIYGGGLGGMTTAGSFRLGDLQVEKSTSNNSSGSGSSGGEGTMTWCELAVLYRNQLKWSNTGMKAVVAGSNYRNPIPSRALRRHD